MILWSIQTEQAWDRLLSRGVLRVTTANGPDPDLEPSDHWMIAQMVHRVGPPPAPDCYPVWAWCQCQSEERKRPDLRAGGHLPRGQRGVRIEFECDPEEALLSDFVLWHHVLNYWYLPESLADGNRFEAELERQRLSFFETKPVPDQRHHRRIVRSWDRIFDLDWEEEDFAGSRSEKAIQATVWELRLDQVRQHTRFRAR